ISPMPAAVRIDPDTILARVLRVVGIWLGLGGSLAPGFCVAVALDMLAGVGSTVDAAGVEPDELAAGESVSLSNATRGGAGLPSASKRQFGRFFSIASSRSWSRSSRWRSSQARRSCPSL